MDRFDAMQTFARVVDTGSFTKAAETLHMSRTSVTQLVQQLEARLRVRLLNRTTRKLNLTADGAAYYERWYVCWRNWTMPRPASPAPPWRPAGVSGSTYRARWRGCC